MVDIRLTKLNQTLKKLQLVTNYAILTEDLIQKKTDEARAQVDEENQEGEPHTKAKVDETMIRRTVTKALHDLMDAQLNDRQCKLNLRFTTRTLTSFGNSLRRLLRKPTSFPISSKEKMPVK